MHPIILDQATDKHIMHSINHKVVDYSSIKTGTLIGSDANN